MVKPVKAYLSSLLLSIAGVMFASHAIAVECYTQSPNLTKLQDDYYGLDRPAPLSREDTNKVNAVFRAMAGQWKGNMWHLECRGPDRAPRTISNTALITAKANLVSTTGLDINAKKHDAKNKTKKPEFIALIGKNPAFDLTFTPDDHVVFSERHRRLNQVSIEEAPVEKPSLISKLKSILGSKKKQAEPIKQPTSRITETIYDIVVNGDSLSLARHYYTNGVYIGEERWKMQRD